MRDKALTHLDHGHAADLQGLRTCVEESRVSRQEVDGPFEVMRNLSNRSGQIWRLAEPSWNIVAWNDCTCIAAVLQRAATAGTP